MINSIKSFGFKWSNKDDLTDKQFTLIDKVIKQNNVVMNSYTFLETQNYKLFSKNFDYNFIDLANSLRQVERINRGANSEFLINSIEMTVDRVENGLEANLNIELMQLS